MIMLLFWQHNVLFLKLSYLFYELIVTVLGVFFENTVLDSAHKIVITCFMYCFDGKMQDSIFFELLLQNILPGKNMNKNKIISKYKRR